MYSADAVVEARSPMLPGAVFEADVVLIAPQEFEVNTAQKTYREKSFTTFTELLSVDSFQTNYIKRINEALGLEAIASYLETADCRTAILNCNVAPHTPEEIARKVAASGAKVVGLSLIYRPQVNFAIDVLEALKDVDDLVVVMGGALASFMPRELLSCLPRLDAVVYGEAEETFRDFCLEASRGGDWRTSTGIVYREGDKVVRNRPGLPLDLAKIITPTRKTLDFLRARGWPTRIASIYTSRGCMAKCTFCSGKDAYNVERVRTYRFRDPVSVASEIEFLNKNYGVRFVYINDDNFLGYGKASFDRVRVFAEELIRRDLGVQFATECRVDGLDRDLLELLKSAGMTQVLLGIESGSDSVLKRWRKGATAEQNKAAIALLNDVAMPLEPGFILFDAHTSAQELSENASFLRDTGLTDTQFPHYLVNRLSVYPGTEVEWSLRLQGVIAPSPIPAAGATIADGPELVRAYFSSLNYTCRDPRTEIAWRCLRDAVEPIEVFLEDRLPTLVAVLTRVRGPGVDKALGTSARRLIHAAGSWRRKIGHLLTDMIDECARSYTALDGTRQMRWLRRRLAEIHEAFLRETLGMSYDTFVERVAKINREIAPYDLAVVVPTVGKWSRLKRTLKSLAAQQLDDPYRWEVIVVLDAVSPPTEDWFDGWPFDLRVVRNEERLGRGGARNQGIKIARSEFVLLIDDDVVFGPGFLKAHLAAQHRRNALYHGPVHEIAQLACIDDLDAFSLTVDATATGKGARLRKAAESVLEQLETDPDLAWSTFGRPNRLETDGARAYDQGRVALAWVAFVGANMSAPRRWLLEQPFDERPGVRWGLEDIALALKLAVSERPLAVIPEARANHLSHQRRNWRSDHAQNRMCFDFLDDQLVDKIIAYLEDDLLLDDLEPDLERVFPFAREIRVAAN